ncbi:hypothetical protein L198_02636 [Cryptococcus wingfieldii CBS 7118]|uniref:Uncharacterized protein n=1 Tax=Cryptococcus wingfieldii CBS 7118 TaxID=1295528 RepID=A0A1E3JP47_9TREE|nr:hypothetical protein L198_02636 [Cryptococcus wingfieldii CBS 7118]ODO01907.1 hypothetical protein L198_02636 [Cryptococcus wingfieldii CBS 7118]
MSDQAVQPTRRNLRSQGDAPSQGSAPADHSSSPLTPLLPSDPHVPLVDGAAPHSLQSEVGNRTSQSDPPLSVHHTPQTAPQDLVHGTHSAAPTVDFLMQQNRFLMSSMANMRDEIRSLRLSQSREATPVSPPPRHTHAPKLKHEMFPKFRGHDDEDVDTWVTSVTAIFEFSGAADTDLLLLLPALLQAVYFDDKRSLQRHLYPAGTPDVDRIDDIINGLPESMQKLVRIDARLYPNLDDFRRALIDGEPSMRPELSRRRQDNAPPRNRHQQRDDQTPSSTQSPPKTPCRFCQGPHWNRDCPQQAAPPARPAQSMAPPAQPPSSAPAYGNFRLASRPENNGPSSFRPASASANGTPLGNSRPPGAFTVFVRPSAATHQHPSDAHEAVYSPPSSDNQTHRVSHPQVPRASPHQAPRVSSPLALHVSTPSTVSAPSSLVVEPSETAPDTVIPDDESATSELVDEPLFLGPDIVSTDDDRDIDIQPRRAETSDPLASFPRLSISREPTVSHDKSPAIAKAHFATDIEGSPLRDIVIDSGAAITLMNEAYANEHLPTLTRHRLEKFQLTGLGAADCASFLTTDLHFPTAEGGEAVIPANNEGRKRYTGRPGG